MHISKFVRIVRRAHARYGFYCILSESSVADMHGRDLYHFLLYSDRPVRTCTKSFMGYNYSLSGSSLPDIAKSIVIVYLRWPERPPRTCTTNNVHCFSILSGSSAPALLWEEGDGNFIMCGALYNVWGVCYGKKVMEALYI